MRTQLPPAFTDRLAELVTMLRNRNVPANSELRWTPPLVKSAIDKLCNEAVAPAEIGIALFRAAEDLGVRSPVLAAGPGPQWEDTKRGETKQATRCPDHPDVAVAKCPCQRVPGSTKPDPERWAALVKQGRDEAAKEHTTRVDVERRRAEAWANNPHANTLRQALATMKEI